MKRVKHEFEKKHIAEGHTLQEYRRYFGFDYDNGRFVSYLPSEVKYMKPHRYYWKIKDEVGQVRYYELPPYIRVKTKHVKALTNIHRGAMWLGIILGSLVLLSSSYIALINIIFPKNNDPIIPLTDLESYAEKYLEWKSKPGSDDITKSEFSVATIAQMSMANGVFIPKEKTVNNKFEVKRNNYIAIGYGRTDTAVVSVNIANMFMYKNGEAIEESISCGESLLLEDATNSAVRDYFYPNCYANLGDHIEGQVKAVTGKNQSIVYDGKNIKDVSCEWGSEPKNVYNTIDEYKSRAGKNPYEPFLYVVDDKTVLNSSKAIKTSEGYSISLDLEPSLSTGIYRKRMEYLSEKETLKFYSVHLDITTDLNLKILSSTVHEHYLVDGGFGPIKVPTDTTGSLTTNYFYDKCDDIDIPEYSTSFNYSNFPDTRC